MERSKIRQYFNQKKRKISELEWRGSNLFHSEKRITCFDLVTKSNSSAIVCVVDNDGKVYAGNINNSNNNNTDSFASSCDFQASSSSTVEVPSKVTLNSIGDRLACCVNKPQVQILHLDVSIPSAKRLEHWTLPESIRCAVYCADERNGSEALILGSSATHRIYVVDCRMNGKICSQLDDNQSISGSNAHLLHIAGGCLLLSASTNRSLKLWDLRITTRPIRSIPALSGSNGPISSTIHVDRAGQILARSDTSGAIRFEELSSGKLIHYYKSAFPADKCTTTTKCGAFVHFASQNPLDCNKNDVFLIAGHQNRYAICDLQDLFLHRVSHSLINADLGEKIDKIFVNKVKWIENDDSFILMRQNNLACIRLQ